MIRQYWPVPGSKLRSEYTAFLVWRDPTEWTPYKTLHGGIDLSLGDNQPHQVIAAAPGRVVASSTKTSYSPGLIVTAGITIFQGKPLVLYLVYGHMSPVAVRENPIGKMVSGGQLLGNYASRDEIKRLSAENKTNPGMASHLHFEVRKTLLGQLGTDKYSSNFDPISFLDGGKLVFGKVSRAAYPVQGW